MVLSGKKTRDRGKSPRSSATPPIQTGSMNVSIADSEDADKAAVVEQWPPKNIKTTSGGSNVAKDVVPLHPARNTFDRFVRSKKFVEFRSRVLADPANYKIYRAELEMENLYVKELLSKNPSRDPLLDKIIDSFDYPVHPGGNAVYKFLQSKQFTEFCSRVLAEPAKYKTFRDEIEMENPYVQRLLSEHQLCDPLLDEIIDGVLSEGDSHHIPIPERFKLVEESAAFQKFKGWQIVHRI